MGRVDGESVMLMPIGRFARASRLSVKSLRNYDESGLLPAAVVDSQSGYRYYRVEQLARADAIRSLRMVEMPLPLIAKALDADDPESLLMSHLEALESQRAEIERKALELKRRIDTKDYTMSTNVSIKNNDAITALFHRTETTYDEIFHDIPAGFGLTMGKITEENLDPVGPPFTLFYQAPDGDTTGDIAMCVPVSAELDLSDMSDMVVTIPAGPVASIIHQGSYENMGESYATVATWIHERGHRIAGPNREIYFNSPAEVSEADLLTEILVPIEAEGTV